MIVEDVLAQLDEIGDAHISIERNPPTVAMSMPWHCSIDLPRIAGYGCGMTLLECLEDALEDIRLEEGSDGD